MIEYIPWGIIGFLSLLVLSLLTLGFFKGWKRPQHSHKRWKHPQHSHKSHSTQVPGETPLADSNFKTLSNAADDLKRHSSDLKSLVQALTDEIQVIQEILYQIVDILESRSLSQESEKVPTQDMQELPQVLQAEQTEKMPPILVEFCNAYNTGKQTGYLKHCRIDVVNAMDRGGGSNESPVFERSKNGKFIVYHIVEEDLYAVVPSSSDPVEKSFYGPGGFSYVFDCLEIDPAYTYSTKVIRPAVFKPDSAEQKWTLEEKGKVELKVLS